jgi:hypothetical protein
MVVHPLGMKQTPGRQHENLAKEITRAEKGLERAVQVAVCLSSKHEALSSNPNITKEKNEVVRVGPLQYDWHPYKKKVLGHR